MYYNASQGRGPRDAKIVLLLAAHAGEVRLCQLTSDKNLQADKTSDKWFVASSSVLTFILVLLSLDHFISGPSTAGCRLLLCRSQVSALQLNTLHLDIRKYA